MKKLLMAGFLAALCYAGAVVAAINVNTADADQLAQLSGVGPVKAKAIVDDREAHGDYKSLDQLTRVTGVGSKTVDHLRAQATVDGADDEQASSN